jgi:hypothetical protein
MENNTLNDEQKEFFKELNAGNIDIVVSQEEAEQIERTRQLQAEIKLSKVLSREELFRFAYVPFVIASLVWDYVDTIFTFVTWHKIEETKKLTRYIRGLKEDYDRLRQPYIDMEHANSEQENMLIYEDAVMGITKQMLTNIRIDLTQEYPQLEKEWIDYLLSIQQAHVLLSALILYVKRQTAKIAKKINAKVGNILPPQMYRLNEVLPQYMGNRPMSPRFATLKRQYINTFATQIALIGLNDDKLSDAE